MSVPVMKSGPGGLRARAEKATLLLVAIAGMAVLGHHTRLGIGVSDDGVLFVAGAQNLQDGLGFSWVDGGTEVRGIAGFPPGYSLLVALAGAAGLNPYVAARWMGVFGFGALIFTVGALVRKTTRSDIAALMAAFLVLTAKNVLSIYAWVMADGLFLLALTLSVAQLASYLSDRKVHQLILASVFGGISVLLRYVGLCIPGGIALALLWVRPAGGRKAVVDALLSTAICLLPFLVLSAVNIGAAGSAVNRSIELLVPDRSTAAGFASEAFSWIFPFGSAEGVRLRWKAAALLAVCVAALGWIQFESRRLPLAGQASTRVRPLALPQALLAMGCSYIVVLLAAISHQRIGEGTIERYLTPVYVMSVILAVVVVQHELQRHRARRLVMGGATLVACAYLALRLAESLNYIGDANSRWGHEIYLHAHPETPALLATMDERRDVVTNEIYFYYYLSGEFSYQVPLLHDDDPEHPREDLPEQYDRYEGWINGGAYLVLFDTIDAQQNEYLSRELLTQGMVPVLTFPGGSVYLRASEVEEGRRGPEGQGRTAGGAVAESGHRQTHRRGELAPTSTWE